MNSANLRDKIEILEQVTTRTQSGAVNIEWQIKFSCRSMVQYSSGNRTIDNDEIFYTVDRDFIIRAGLDVVETDEIRWDNKRWQIRSIDKNREYNNQVIHTTKINE